MKKIIVAILILAFVFSMTACGKSKEEKVEEMIEEAVEEAVEEALEEAAKEDGEEDVDVDVDIKEGSDEESGTITVNGTEYAYSGEEIPEDYPYDVCPLYEAGDAEVVGVISLSSGDDKTYTLGICTNNAIKDVNAQVEEMLLEIYDKSDIQTMAMGDDYYMYMIEAKDWNVTVSVMPDEDSGYETMITYAILSN